MTDSRAALEERASKLCQKNGQLYGAAWMTAYEAADFAEQESSSLKLLLSAIQKGIVEFGYVRGARILFFREIHKIFPVELDSSGIPVLTPEIIEALEAAK